MNLMALESMVKSANVNNYELIRRIGRGRYGEVFEAFNITNNKRYAIKVLKPIKTDKVIREINVLNRLKSGTNIIRLRGVVLNDGIPSLIFSYISEQTLKELSMSLTEPEIKYYLLQLLRAIDFAHNHGVIHRDIKPSNVIIDRKRQVLRLIDWGLAEFYANQKTFSVFVASRFYKSPELLLNNSKYDYSLDMWSFGCIVAGLVFRKEPFFVGLDNLDQLKAITCVLGSNALNAYINKYKLRVLPQTEFILNFNCDYKLWTEFIVKDFEHLVNEIAIDFVDKLLIFDHNFRMTSGEALSHPFFESLGIRK